MVDFSYIRIVQDIYRAIQQKHPPTRRILCFLRKKESSYSALPWLFDGKKGFPKGSGKKWSPISRLFCYPSVMGSLLKQKKAKRAHQCRTEKKGVFRFHWNVASCFARLPISTLPTSIHLKILVWIMWRILAAATRNTEDAKYQGQISHGVQWKKLTAWWFGELWES